jgi:hypothetical protein
MAVHNGRKAPTLNEDWNPLDDEPMRISWTTKLDTRVISTSEWIIPTGWTVSNELTNISVTVSGVLYNDVNSADLTTTNTDGIHYIANKVTTVSGDIISRGFYVRVDADL